MPHIDQMTTLADFTLELTACDQPLMPSAHLVGYRIFGGAGLFTAEGGRGKDSAYEEVICRVRAEGDPQTHTMVFQCSYELVGGGGVIERVLRHNVEVDQASSSLQLTPEQAHAAIVSIKSVLRADEVSIMSLCD